MSDLNRFGNELYPWDPFESDPRHGKWKSMSNCQLIVGRGTGLTWWSKTAQESYLPIDSFGGVFKSSTDHLWMDFNIGSQYLCSNWAKSITIDYSTWRYIKPIRILKDLHRILKSDGSIYFEHGISSFTISNRNGFDFDNPSHLILTRQRLIEWIGDTQILAKFFAKYRGQTVIVPAYSERTETIEKQIGQSLKIATMDYLYESYCKEFSEYFQVSRTMLDLETSKPVFQWIQLTPIAIDS